jgi:hypothetical protein
VDTLEIHLREICDVVDKIFIMEATASHNGLWNSKPLAWEAIKHQSRFQFCSHKIVHFVMDDADVTFQRKPDAWTLESLQDPKGYLLEQLAQKFGMIPLHDFVVRNILWTCDVDGRNRMKAETTTADDDDDPPQPPANGTGKNERKSLAIQKETQTRT